MKKHVHGGNVYQHKNVTDFSANLNPLGMPESVRDAAIGGVCRSERYPDPDSLELREAIAAAAGTEASKVICGNGAAELIFLLAAAKKPKKALLPAPTFAEYETALSACGCECVFYRLKEETGFCLKEDFIEAITEGTELVYLCNPNNPTGVLTEKTSLLRILDRCRSVGALLVIDECFLELTGKKELYTMEDQLSGGSLFLLKAFTKTYAMAGLRLGYGLTEEQELLDQMNGLRQPWSVSLPAACAGLAALKETAYVKRSVDYISRERKWLSERLRSFPMKLYEGSANYLFFYCDRKGLWEALLSRGILIRDCSNYRGLSKGYYRIAVRTHEENEALIRALKLCFS